MSVYDIGSIAAGNGSSIPGLTSAWQNAFNGFSPSNSTLSSGLKSFADQYSQGAYDYNSDTYGPSIGSWVDPTGNWQLSKTKDGYSIFGLNGNGGPGSTIYNYNPDGSFLNNTTGSGTMSYLQGILSVAGAAAGMNAIGGLASGAGAVGSGAGAGVTGLGDSGALDILSGSLDGGATLGGGASVAGGSALGNILAGSGAAAGGGTSLSSILSGLSSGGSSASNALGALSSILGGGSGGGSSDTSSILSTIAPWLLGLNDSYQKNQASNNMLDWLKGQQSKIDNLYNPGSAEYNALWDQMSRADAAAGRNSQLGPRSVDLAAKIAQIKANATANLTSGVQNSYSGALNGIANANSIPGIAALLGNNSNSTANLSSLLSLLQQNQTPQNLSSTVDTSGNQGYDIASWWDGL